MMEISTVVVVAVVANVDCCLHREVVVSLPLLAGGIAVLVAAEM